MLQAGLKNRLASQELALAKEGDQETQLLGGQSLPFRPGWTLVRLPQGPRQAKKGCQEEADCVWEGGMALSSKPSIVPVTDPAPI